MIHWLISPLPDWLIDPLALSPPLLFHLSPTMISLKTGTIKKLSIMEKFEKRAVSMRTAHHRKRVDEKNRSKYWFVGRSADHLPNQTTEK